MKIRILIADDNKLFRELLVHRFSETPDIEVIAEAEDSKQVFDEVRKAQPDIILIDIGIPRLKGIETIKLIQHEYSKVKFIALTSRAEKIHIKGTLEAGAWGYHLKSCTFDQIATAIRQVYDGKKTVSAEVEGIIIDDYLGHHSSNSHTLTERENQILKLLAEGKSIREISEILFISIKTVGTHKQNIFDKMGFSNLAQLVNYAIK
ncbi:MAG: response regulator transcription factor, partial [Bacteroidota bacterium]|nr:response regulator transcription factor [Bacteroidota bacterium]